MCCDTTRKNDDILNGTIYFDFYGQKCFTVRHEHYGVQFPRLLTGIVHKHCYYITSMFIVFLWEYNRRQRDVQYASIIYYYIQDGFKLRVKYTGKSNRLETK